MVIQHFESFHFILIRTYEKVGKGLNAERQSSWSDVFCIARKPLQTCNLGRELDIRRPDILHLVHGLLVDEFLEKYPQLIRFFNKLAQSVEFSQHRVHLLQLEFQLINSSSVIFHLLECLFHLLA